MRGVSLEEVSSATRIRTKFLEAIESGQWDQLPGGAFNRGFIRSTSRYLGLDEDGMVAEYALETRSNGPSCSVSRQPSDLRRSSKRVAGATAAILVLLAGGWFARSRVGARGRAPISASGRASVGVRNHDPSGASEADPTRLHLVVRASRTTGLRVIGDGKPVFDGQIQANEEKDFDARNGFEVRASNSAALRLELNGQPFPRIDSAGRPARITLTAKDVKSSAGGVH
jgi:Helix-turn-helix domain/Domain of unknown function (DUF4115)